MITNQSQVIAIKDTTINISPTRVTWTQHYRSAWKDNRPLPINIRASPPYTHKRSNQNVRATSRITARYILVPTSQTLVSILQKTPTNSKCNTDPTNATIIMTQPQYKTKNQRNPTVCTSSDCCALMKENDYQPVPDECNNRHHNKYLANPRNLNTTLQVSLERQ